jgi:predicted MFS family arabinose efflux permease
MLMPLLVLVGVNILNFYDRHVPGALAEPMRKEFGLTDSQLGLLGSAFIWLYAIVGVPLGHIADRWSRKKLLAGGMVVWSALTAMAGLATNFGMLIASRLGVALGEAVAAPTGTSWIGDLFPPAQRARALSLFMLGVPIGGALSFFFSGPIAQAWGWRAAMVFAAVPALMLTPALMMLYEPKRGAAETHQHRADTGSMWVVLRIPTLWWIIASGVFINFNMYAMGSFLPAFLSRIHGVSVAKSGIATGFVYLIGGVAGGYLAGRWGDRIVHRRKDGRMLSAAIFAVLGAPAVYVAIVLPAGTLFLATALLTFAYGTMNSYYGLVYSSIQDIVPPAKRGTTMAIYFMLMYMCGASFGPYLTGHLSDTMARRAAEAAGSATITEAFRAVGLQQAMVIIPVLSTALAVVLWAGSRTIIRDMARRDAAEAPLGASTSPSVS